MDPVKDGQVEPEYTNEQRTHHKQGPLPSPCGRLDSLYAWI